jgi:hypothetical protein
MYDDQNNNDNDDDELPRFLGNNQSCPDAFLSEGWWVITMMMTMKTLILMPMKPFPVITKQ